METPTTEEEDMRSLRTLTMRRSDLLNLDNMEVRLKKPERLTVM